MTRDEILHELNTLREMIRDDCSRDRLCEYVDDFRDKLQPTNQPCPDLTDRQRDIFNFMLDYREKNGWPPTVREIGKRFDISSPNGVLCHLKALKTKGIIQRGKNLSRCIKFLRTIPMPGGVIA